jgi:phosphonate transport system permease protein
LAANLRPLPLHEAVERGLGQAGFAAVVGAPCAKVDELAGTGRACRAINEIVFALLFVVAVGLGPLAGVLAVAVHNIGIIAKLFSEAVEAIDPRPVEGIRATGATRLQEVIFGIVPQVMPLWSSYTLYRFETNVRSATVLGIVGAGGIGHSLYENIRSFHYSETAAIVIIVVVTVMLIDLVSARIRKSLV